MPAPKPLELLKQEGKSHCTKKELELRKESEARMSLGEANITMPVNVRANTIARTEWYRIIKLYDNFSFVSSADRNILARYCMTHAEYMDLILYKKKIVEKAKKDDLEAIDIVNILDKSNIDHMINKKTIILQKLEAALFLEPVSRIRAVPQPEEKKPPSRMESLGFGGI